MKSQSNKNQSHDSQMQTNLEHIRSKPSPIRGKKQKTTDVKFSKTQSQIHTLKNLGVKFELINLGGGYSGT